jgi:hypothetical protein
LNKKKIGILSHFSSFDPGYALHVGWLERAKLLKYYDQDFDFLVQENCKTDIYPNILKVLPKLKSGLEFGQKVKVTEEVYKKILPKYDCVLTADILYQKGGHFLAWNQALRNAADCPKLKAKYFHWVHSSWVRHQKVDYPESLRYSYMPKSVLVYMNTCEMANLATMYNTNINNVACVYNTKDIRSFYNFTNRAWEITKRLKLMTKDAVQIFPHSSTRMDAKGINPIIWVFAALKQQGKKVGLVFANAHGNKVKQELADKKKELKKYGLVENEDFIFTSDLFDYQALDRETVSNLFLISNLFVFASWREVCPNVLLEAQKSPNILLVLNEATLPLREFGGKEFNGREVIYFKSTSKTPGKQDGERGDTRGIAYNKFYYQELAKKIIEKLPKRDYIYNYSFEHIWETQFRKLLYGV